MATERKFYFPMSAASFDISYGVLARGVGVQSGIVRTMNASNNGTVKAVSPCAGLYVMPFLARRGNSWVYRDLLSGALL